MKICYSSFYKQNFECHLTRFKDFNKKLYVK
jgi:hypothetical protein